MDILSELVIVVVISNTNNGHYLGEKDNQDCEEKQENFKVCNNSVNHGHDVTQTLEDSEIEERLNDLLDENDCHQDFVTEGLGVTGVLGDHVYNTAPDVELIRVVLRVMEILHGALFVELS